jgi:hypothetical protein
MNLPDTLPPEIEAHIMALMAALAELMEAMNDAAPGDPRVNLAVQSVEVGIHAMIGAAYMEGFKAGEAPKLSRKTSRQKRVAA